MQRVTQQQHNQNFYSILDQFFSPGTYGQPTEAQRVNAVFGDTRYPSLLNGRDIRALRATSRGARNAIGAESFTATCESAVRELRSFCRIWASDASMVIRMTGLRELTFDAPQLAFINPLGAAKRLHRLATAPGVEAFTESLQNKWARKWDLSWYAIVCSINHSTHPTVQGPTVNKIAFFTSPTAPNNDYRKNMLKKMVIENAITIAAVGAPLAGVGVLVTNKASLILSGKVATANAIAGSKVISAQALAGGVGATLLGGVLIYGGVRNLIALLTETPDVWCTDYFRHAFLFYMMSQHQSFDTFDYDLSPAQIFAQGWHLGDGQGSPIQRVAAEILCIGKSKAERDRIFAQWLAEGRFQ